MSEKGKNNTQNSGGKKRDLILGGTVNEESIHKLVDKIIEINRYDEDKLEKDSSYTPKPIKIYVNTYGGALYDANMLIGIIESSKTPIHTYCSGKAMSAGLYIYVSGHKRFASKLATFMYHDASTGQKDTVEGLKREIDHVEKLRDRYDQYIISRTKLPKELMDKTKRHKEELYLFADEALEYGIVDEII
ncbi:ATP-dependent Clp protease proteolytic subunit [Bacillus licheniformis]